MGSSRRIWIVPGRLWNARRPQQRPESVTTGITGSCGPRCQRRDAWLQRQQCARCGPGALGEDHDLPPLAHRPLAFAHQTTQRRARRLQRSTAIIPASGISGPNSGMRSSSRFNDVAAARHQREPDERVECRLVARGDQGRPRCPAALQPVTPRRECRRSRAARPHMMRAHSCATSSTRCGAANRTGVASARVSTKVATKKNTLNRAERSSVIRHGRHAPRGSRSGSTAVRPVRRGKELEVLLGDQPQRHGDMVGSLRLARPARDGASPRAVLAPARSAHAACDTTPSPPAMNGCRWPRPRRRSPARCRGSWSRCDPIVTRAASGSGSTPARCASSANSAPPPIPESSSRSARPSASRRSAVSTRSGPPVKATIPSACAGAWTALSAR